MASFGQGYRYHVTGLNHDEYGFPTNSAKLIGLQEERLIKKVEENYDDIVQVEHFMCEDAEHIIFAFGSSARASKDAVLNLRKKGIKAGLLKPLTIWPFPDREIAEYASKVKDITVVELSVGQSVREVSRAAGGRCNIKHIYKVDSEPISPVDIEKAVEG